MPSTNGLIQPHDDFHWIYLLATGSTGVKAKLGEGSATVEGGLGGWESVPRPGRRPLTVWRGPEDPLRMGLPLVFDGYPEPGSDQTVVASVEADVRQLERIAGVAMLDDPVPPFITVMGAVPHDLRWAPRNQWVIEHLEWGEAERRVSDGQRVRQLVDVTLMLYTTPDSLTRLSAQSKPKKRKVKAKKGDTAIKIAAREIGAAADGPKLARLNGFRSADVALTEGLEMVIPGMIIGGGIDWSDLDG
jgi:hypothetical protein